jgi:hypothetical protein
LKVAGEQLDLGLVANGIGVSQVPGAIGYRADLAQETPLRFADIRGHHDRRFAFD